MDQSLRVLVLGDAASTHVRVMATALADRGVDFTTVSARPPRGPLPGVVHVVGERANRALRLVHLRRKAQQLLAQERFDLVHAHFVTSYGLAAALSGASPLLVSVWGSDVLALPKRGGIYTKIVRFTLKQATAIAVTSDALARGLIGHAPQTKQPYVTPFGVELERFSLLPEDPGTFTVVAPRHLWPNYGNDVLVRAFAQMVARWPDSRLLLTGGGPQREELELLANSLGVRSAVTFLGPISHDEMASTLAASHVAVLPSVGHEGYGVAALEAAACGRPVVASDIGGLREVVAHEKTGILVPPRDPVALYQALCDLRTSPERRRTLGMAGRAMVEDRFTAPSAAERMISVYEEVVRAAPDHGCRHGRSHGG